MSEELTITETIAHLMSEQMPNDGGSCKSQDCEGEVVAQVNSFFRRQYVTDTPACDTCGRAYTLAKNSRKVGIEEFNKSLFEPVTI